MSNISVVVQHAVEFVRQVPDPPADAPQGLKDAANSVLGLIKWASIISIVAVLFAAGTMVWAGDRGYGGGLSPELKGKLANVAIALVIVGSAAQIVTFLS